MTKRNKTVSWALGAYLAAALAVGAVSPAPQVSPGFGNVFRTAEFNTTGNNLMWSPTASGKNVRVQCFRIEVTGQSSVLTGGSLHVTFRQGTSTATAQDITGLAATFYVPNLALNLFGNTVIPWADMGNGVPLDADNKLYIGLDKTLLSGVVRVSTQGVEEPETFLASWLDLFRPLTLLKRLLASA